MKLLVAALGAYLFPPLYRFAVSRWWPAAAPDDPAIRYIRRVFWEHVYYSGLVVWTTVYLMGISGHLDVEDPSVLLRTFSVWLALSSSLGRGGGKIVTWKLQSLPERIDRWMFKISQLGAAAMIIMAFSL